MPVTSLRYPTPWSNFAIDWSPNSPNFCTIGVASFVTSLSNQAQVITAAKKTDAVFTEVSQPLSFDYVATKLMWSPSLIKGNEFMAISGDGLSLWKWQGDGAQVYQELVTKLISKANPRKSIVEGLQQGGDARNPPAPLPSFDWNVVDPSLIVVASYDTTCTVWDINSCTIKTQLIAHDKEVFDVAFSPKSAETFVSVGADGSLRLFDIRSLDHSTIIYETPDARPLLKVAWNPLDTNYLATFGADSQTAVIMDIRMPSIPAAELTNHDSSLLTMRWSPTSSSHLITGDEDYLKLWNLQASPSQPQLVLPTAGITGGSSAIHQLVWPRAAPEWLAASTSDCVYTFQL